MNNFHQQNAMAQADELAATDHYREALDIYYPVLSTRRNHPEANTSISRTVNIGETHERIGNAHVGILQHGEAAANYQEAWTIYTLIFGPAYPITLRVHRKLELALQGFPVPNVPPDINAPAG